MFSMCEGGRECEPKYQRAYTPNRLVQAIPLHPHTHIHTKDHTHIKERTTTSQQTHEKSTRLVHELGREVDAELGGDGAEPALPVAVLRVELLDGRLARGDVRRGLLVLVVVMSPCVEPAGRGH